MKMVNCLFIFLLCMESLYAQSYTFSGYVIDGETGETLIGVNVQVKAAYRGAATDGNGYFCISGMKPGKYLLKISYIGYLEKEIPVMIENKSIVLPDIALEPKAIEMKEIVVAGNRSEIADISIEPGLRDIMPKAIESIPTSKGDVFRALKYLPGVEGVDPFSPLFSARGGESGENLVLLDGIPIYNPYHFVTASGLFNLYALKKTELLVGGFSAEYGGRNSSVLYITTREGNNKKLHGEFETSTSLTNAVFDFPVGNNATMMISGRVFYDLIARFFLYSPNYFYDMNISLNWKLNRQNRLNLRYFHSNDYMDYSFARFSSYFATSLDTDIFDDYDVIFRNNWRNQAVTAILKTIISPQVYLQTQFSGSFFSSDNQSTIDFEYHDEEDDEYIKFYYRTKIRNKIQDMSGKSTLNLQLNSANALKVGLEYNRYFFSNDIRINYVAGEKNTKAPNSMAGFIEHKLDLGLVSFRPGARFSKFSFMDRWYYEPRINILINLPNKIKLKSAWGQYYQYIISINSQEYEISQFLDNYYPLELRKPSASTHYILGFEKTISENSNLSVDFYYKDISRVYTFDSDLSTVDVFQFTDKLKQGAGKAYGVEILWQGTYNNFSGWLAYGLSRSERSYPHIMNEKSFLFDYDRTHSFKAVVNHQIHPMLSYSGTLQILSGVPKTLERSNMSYYHYNPQSGQLAIHPTFVADRKNNIRLPLYVRLDLGLKKRIRKGFGAELAEFLGAKESYLNVTFGNILFLKRNVWFYIPLGEEKLYGLGSNYFPEFSMGYSIKF